ncbi:hypothetical protein [Runella zeae]|uniref:hypothetical protein n=1 Tax=Runella zeae TaxID=94255 RepID=UPI002353A691|nr:hypothetical protein [Runella zeae]
MEGIPKKSDFEWALFFSIWGFVLIALPALYMSITSARDKKQVIENQTFAVATIDAIEEKRLSRTYTPYLRFHYHYAYKNQLIKDHVDYKYQRYFVDFTKNKWRLVEQKQFPVILSSKDVSTHKILIFWSDFSKYGLPFPDSLKWSEKVFYNK